MVGSGRTRFNAGLSVSVFALRCEAIAGSAARMSPRPRKRLAEDALPLARRRIGRAALIWLISVAGGGGTTQIVDINFSMG